MTLEASIDAIRPSVVQICMHTVGGEDHHVRGTGFFVIDVGHVLTASHVVPQSLDADVDQLCIAVPGPTIPGLDGVPRGLPMFLHAKARVVASDVSNDLALIAFVAGPLGPALSARAEGIEGEHSLELRPVTLASSVPDAGTAIAASGFPVDQSALVTTAGIVAADYAKDDAGALRVLGDLTLNTGNSGGPVYLAKTGEVIGVASQGIQTPADTPEHLRGKVSTLAGLALIVPVSTIHAFLSAVEPLLTADV